MSAADSKSGLIAPRVVAEVDEEIDAMEALAFARGQSGVSSRPITVAFEDDATVEMSLAETGRLGSAVSVVAVARRLSMKVQLHALAKFAEGRQPNRGTRPPGLTSPTAMATPEASASVVLAREPGQESAVRLPRPVRWEPRGEVPRAMDSSPDFAGDETLVMAPTAPAREVTLVGPRDGGPTRPAVWAVVVSMTAIALPAGLFLDQTLFSRSATMRSVQASAAASHAPEDSPAPRPTGPGEMGPTPATEPSVSTTAPRQSIDPHAVVDTLRYPHHGRAKSVPRPAASAAASGAKPTKD
jgi:hypothetical protein